MNGRIIQPNRSIENRVHGIRSECRSTLLIFDNREFSNAYPLSLVVKPSGNEKQVVEFENISCLVQYNTWPGHELSSIWCQGKKLRIPFTLRAAVSTGC